MTVFEIYVGVIRLQHHCRIKDEEESIPAPAIKTGVHNLCIKLRVK